MRLFYFFMVTFLIPYVVGAEIIGVNEYEYKYNGAKGINSSTFVFCDCVTPSLVLAPKEVSQVEQKKSNILMANLAVKVPEMSSPKSAVVKEVEKKAIGDNKTEYQFGIALGTIFFAFDSSKLSSDATQKLNKIISTIKDNNVSDITINGYTCDIGTIKYNNQLAQERANAVASYLKSKGVDIRSVNGEGKCCYVSAVKKDNRRVEIMGYMPGK